MTDSTDNPGSPAGQAQSSSADRELFEASMREFAEGATALAAASIRMQVIMLEQTREMFGAIDAMGASDEPSNKPED